MHTSLFTLANTVEAAALGNEPASPVSHTSLQLLTKFHCKNLYCTREHKGMQEHSFIFRYQGEFVGQELKSLFYTLRSMKSATTHHTTTHNTASYILPHISLFAGLSLCFSQGLQPFAWRWQQPKAPTFYSLRKAASVAMLLPTHELMALRPLELWHFTHYQQWALLCTSAAEELSQPEQKCTGSITSILSLSMKRLIWRLRLQIQVNFSWNMQLTAAFITTAAEEFSEFFSSPYIIYLSSPNAKIWHFGWCEMFVLFPEGLCICEVMRRLFCDR